MSVKWDTSLRLSAQRALLGAVGPNLVTFSGEIREKIIRLRWVVLNEAGEDEIEDYRVVGTEIFSDYVDDVQLEEEFIRVSVASEARDVPYLSNLFFLKNVNGASSNV